MLQTPVAAEAPAGVVRALAPLSRYRVLMVAPTSFFADYGCHVRILEEARTLTRLGQHVTIVTYRSGRDVPGIRIRRTLPIPWRRGYEVGSSRHKVAFDALLALRALPLALSLRPDVIHGHLHEGALIGGVLARLTGKPIVFDYQGSLSAEMVDHGFLRPEGRRRAAVRRLEARINRLADAIVTSSAPAARLLTDEFGIPAERVVSLPDCVDTESFKPGLVDSRAARELEASLGIPPGRQIVVYLGLLAPYQGTDHLLTAAAKVVAQRPSTHFLIMGFPGTDLYAARAAAAGLGDHVTFTGRVAFEAAPYHLALGSVAVAPKLSATEGSGKVLTYMAMGLPVVAFDTAVSRDYLGHHGRYAAPGDAEGLASRVLELLDDPEAARRLGAVLRRRAAESFAWDRAGRRILDVYDAVTGRAPLRGAEGVHSSEAAD